MKKKTNWFYNAIYLCALFFSVLTFSCFNECGDIFSRSPEQLISENDFVLLGRFVSMDTLANLGEFNYLDSESNFFIMEYQFRTEMPLKGATKNSTIFLWNCEQVRKKDNYTTITKLTDSETCLVYGREIAQSDSLMNVMTPFALVEQLKLLLADKEPTFDWGRKDVQLAISKKNHEI